MKNRFALLLFLIACCGTAVWADESAYYIIHPGKAWTNRIPKFGDAPFVDSSHIFRTSSNGLISTQLGAVLQNPDAVLSIEHDVEIDANISVRVIVVRTGGRFTIRDGRNLTIKFCEFIGEPNSKIEVGTAPSPIRSDVRFVVRALPLNRDNPAGVGYDPNGFGRGMIFLGDVSMYGVIKTPFMRLKEAPRAGDTTLQLLHGVSGWNAGDKIFIPDTRIIKKGVNGSYKGAILVRDHTESETNIIAGINGDRLTLASALQYSHLGSASKGTTFSEEPCNPHVANLTRTIVVESEDPDVIRGHTLASLRSHAVISGVNFLNLGRTRAVRLDSTEFDADGNVTKLGINQIGRYPWHWHMCAGPFPVRDAYQGRFENSVVDTSDKWLLAIHDSSHMLVKNNVAVGGLVRANEAQQKGNGRAGGGIVSEKGNEFWCRIEGNFIAEVPGDESGQNHEVRTDEQLAQGDGIPLVGVTNDLINNVIAATHIGEGEYPGFGGFGSDNRRPLFQGGNIYVDGEYEMVGSRYVPYGQHEGAEMYSIANLGKAAWANHHQGFELIPNGRPTKYTFWNMGAVTIFQDYSIYTINGLRAFDGLTFYFAHNPTGRERPEFNDMLLKNYEMGITWDNRPPINHDVATAHLPTMRFNNCTFVDVLTAVQMHNQAQGSFPKDNIFLLFKDSEFLKDKAPHVTFIDYEYLHPSERPPGEKAQVIWVAHRVEAYNWQKQGANVQFFSDFQAPELELPKYCSNWIGFNGPVETCLCADTKPDGSNHTVQSCADEFTENSVPFHKVATCKDTHELVKNGYLCVKEAGSNNPPVVKMPSGKVITFPQSVSLTAEAADDGLPDPPAAMTFRWRKVGGPGSVTFSKETELTTDATFSLPGNYSIRFIADDGDLQTGGDVSIVVVDPNGANLPPIIDAGKDQTIPFPDIARLKGAVLDDGKPTPPGRITVEWKQISGLGKAAIADPSALETTVSFDRAATYVLQLIASDGALGSSDEIVINVTGKGNSPGANENGGGSGGRAQRVLMPSSGKNEVIIPDCSNARLVDQRGHKISSFQGTDLRWNGSLANGKRAASGIYRYDCQEGEDGSIAVVR